MAKKKEKTPSKKKGVKRGILFGVIGLILVAVIITGVSRNRKDPREALTLKPVPAKMISRGSGTADVALVRSSKAKAEDISDEEVREMVREAVALAGGLESIVSDGDFVVLKPNLIAAKHYSGPMFSAMKDGDGYSDKSRILDPRVNGIATDFRVIKAAAELVREINPNGKIYIMETSGWCNTPDNMKLLGWTKENIPYVDEILTFDDTGKDYNNLDTDDLVAVDLGDRKRFTDDVDTLTKGFYYIDKIYYSADVIISLPVLKSHMNAAITGGVKNVGIGTAPINVYSTGGGTPRLNRMSINHAWEPLNKFIHDFFLVKPVDFVITDGLQGTENGPVAIGSDSLPDAQKNMRLILAGKDAVAVDSIHSLIIGMDPRKVDYLTLLAEDDAGIVDPSRINVVGNAGVGDVKKHFGVPGFPMNLMSPEPSKKEYEDFTSPNVKAENVAVSSKSVSADLVSDEEIIKADIYIDGKFTKAVTGKGNELKINYSDEDLEDVSTVEIRVYDNFLNGTSVKLKG